MNSKPNYDVINAEAQENSKGKHVRFADTEGQDLCKIFFINCPSNCRRKKRNKWPKKRGVKKTLNERCALSICQLPWDSDLLLHRVENLNVSLEKVVKTQKGIIGMVAVKNIDYRKEIFARYSFNNWKTQKDTQAAFYKEDQTTQIDYFVFVITDKISETNLMKWYLQFALCYKVVGKEFWDNNSGWNYLIISDK
eukprot:gene3462-3958_t